MRRRAFWLDLCLVAIVVVAGVVCREDRPSPEPRGEPTPQQLRAAIPYYTAYLDGRQVVTKPCHRRTYWAVYGTLRNLYVDELDDAELVLEVERELRVLLAIAQVDAGRVDQVPLDLGLPEEVAQAYSEELPEELVWLAACHGLAFGTDDPFTSFMDGPEYADLDECGHRPDVAVHRGAQG